MGNYGKQAESIHELASRSGFVKRKRLYVLTRSSYKEVLSTAGISWVTQVEFIVNRAFRGREHNLLRRETKRSRA